MIKWTLVVVSEPLCFLLLLSFLFKGSLRRDCSVYKGTTYDENIGSVVVCTPHS